MGVFNHGGFTRIYKQTIRELWGKLSSYRVHQKWCNKSQYKASWKKQMWNMAFLKKNEAGLRNLVAREFCFVRPWRSGSTLSCVSCGISICCGESRWGPKIRPMSWSLGAERTFKTRLHGNLICECDDIGELGRRPVLCISSLTCWVLTCRWDNEILCV